MKLSHVLFGALAVVVMAALPAQADPVADRVKELLPWVAKKTGYSMEHVAPRVLYKTIEEIAYIDPTYQKNSIEVDAMTIDNIIILLDTFTLGKNDKTIVHELVHVLQNANGHVVGERPGDFRCLGEAEREAYLTADAWVEETGIGEKTNKTVLFFMTRCPSRIGPL